MRPVSKNRRAAPVVKPTVIGVVITIAIASLVGLAACVDLFHSSDDVVTACAVDPTTPGCNPVCAPSSDAPLTRAKRVCAWLGACEGPLGSNAFGPCVFQALLAYDCASNRNHQVQGTTQAFWTCMAGVSTCAGVAACVDPDHEASCVAAGSTTCATDGVRVACVASASDDADAGTDAAARPDGDAGAAASALTEEVESCAATGTTCMTSAAGTSCQGSLGSACSTNVSGCYSSGPDAAIQPASTHLHWCVNGADIGVDCANNGARACTSIAPAAGAPWVACQAQGKDTCPPSTVATCDGGVAASCTSGVAESIDCAALLGTSAQTACTAGPLAVPFDWTSPCQQNPPRCTADSCNGDELVGCARGAPFTVTCGGGLGPCRMVPDPTGALHAACTAPPP